MDSCAVCSFAATVEARSLNRSSPGKFIAAPKHKDPYSMRDGSPTVADSGDIGDDDDSSSVGRSAPGLIAGKSSSKHLSTPRGVGTRVAPVQTTTPRSATTPPSVSKASGGRKRKVANNAVVEEGCSNDSSRPRRRSTRSHRT
jgi:hypothetical protein